MECWTFQEGTYRLRAKGVNRGEKDGIRSFGFGFGSDFRFGFSYSIWRQGKVIIWHWATCTFGPVYHRSQLLFTCLSTCTLISASLGKGFAPR